MGFDMAIQFANSFLSYLLVFIVFVVVGGVAIALGITARKMKNKKTASADTAVVEEKSNV